VRRGPTLVPVAADTVTDASIATVNVGTPRATPGGPDGRAWRSGIWKSPVLHPVPVGTLGLNGDGQADTVHHGGAEKAVLLYALSHYADWCRELGRDDLGPGGFGENVTASGLDETTVCLGDTWRVGGAVLQVTQPRTTCWKLARRWGIPDLTERAQDSRRTGWYHRVLEEGTIAAGDGFALLDRPHPQWSVARATAVYNGRRTSTDGMAEVAALEEVSAAWRDVMEASLARRV
jgi:MOSC domain-containing protein YiiM